MTAFYTDRTSARPGGRIALHATSGAGPCSLEIARIGKSRELVATIGGIEVGNHPTPARADINGCGWPVAREIEVGLDWKSGYYDLRLTDSAGNSWHHFLCVRPAAGTRGAPALLVLNTNTYNSYNYWGGASAYCDVAALMSGAKPLPEAMKGAIGVMSTQRPYPQAIVAAPSDAPRLVNMRKRGFKENPWASDTAWAIAHRMTPYDGSAGFLNKWEHVFVEWAEDQGIALDYATDYDLEAEADALDGYSAVLLVGHSEYWTANERDALERFVDAGGGLAIFSGNTAFWKVRYEDDGKTYVCHKWKGFEADPAASIEDPTLATHLWSHSAFARPEAEITGLTFLYGGYHRLGMCAARGQGGYTIYHDQHWALEGADLFFGDVIGDDIPLLGYENDGCRFYFGDDGLPKPVTSLGVPENLEIIGIAPCAFGEDPANPYSPIIPPENLQIIATDVFGDPALASNPGLIRGHAVMASFKRGEGEVFNAGTTEWAHALKAGDPYVACITRNVLRRFGAA